MNGLLIIDKPAGITSHDVAARCRKILKTKRVGHTGTLDPFATGVMVILVGKATRLAQFLDKDVKEYEASVKFGFETDTGDRTGAARITNYESRDVSREEIENVLATFRGEIEQTPPMYSAKKVDGKKLYELARKGVEIERQAVKINIYKLEITALPEPESAVKEKESARTDLKAGNWSLKLTVSCSAGTYIRVLAEDIGKKLCVGAHLSELRRTRAGNFDLRRAVSLEELERKHDEGKLGELLISMNEAVSHLPKIVLSETEVEKTRNGIKLEFTNKSVADNQAVRMIDKKENLIAVGFCDKREKCVRPKTVLI